MKLEFLARDILLRKPDKFCDNILVSLYSLTRATDFSCIFKQTFHE